MVLFKPSFDCSPDLFRNGKRIALVDDPPPHQLWVEAKGSKLFGGHLQCITFRDTSINGVIGKGVLVDVRF